MPVFESDGSRTDVIVRGGLLLQCSDIPQGKFVFYRRLVVHLIELFVELNAANADSHTLGPAADFRVRFNSTPAHLLADPDYHPKPYVYE